MELAVTGIVGFLLFGIACVLFYKFECYFVQLFAVLLMAIGLVGVFLVVLNTFFLFSVQC